MIGRPVFVAGCPRSGTTLTVRALAACGLWTGPTSAYAENMELKREALKPMLRAGGMDDMAITSFADVSGDPEWVRRRVLAVLQRQGCPGGPWIFKDVKLVFCWRAWAEAFPDAVWVTVWREPAAILESFGRWNLARQHDAFDGARIIREHHRRAREIPAFPAHPDRLMRGDDSEYRAICDAIGVEWAPGPAHHTLDPSRYHLYGETI